MTAPSYDSTAALASLAQPEDFIMVQRSLVVALDGDHLAAILLARISYRCRRGPWRATLKDLAEETLLAERTIRRRVQALRDVGLLTAEPAGGFDRAYTYTVPNQPVCADTSIRPERPDQSGRRGHIEADSEATSSLLLEVENKNKKGEPLATLAELDLEPPPTPAATAPEPPADLAFQEFWHRYPRKAAKPRAARAWKLAAKDTTPDVILAGLARSIPLWRGRDPQFIPHPATWLNERRWEDVPLAPTWRGVTESSGPSPGSPEWAEQQRALHEERFGPSETLDEYNARIDREMAEEKERTAQRRAARLRGMAAYEADKAAGRVGQA